MSTATSPEAEAAPRNRGRTALLAAATAVLTVLLFVGSPGRQWPRSALHLWDLGHVALFACAGALVVRSRRVARWGLAAQAGLVLAGTAVLGAATELLQARFQRSPELGDFGRDLLGAALALAFVSPAVARLPGTARRALRIGVLAWLAVQMAPATAALLDEHLAKHQFPVLADFETPLETDRWAGNAAFTVTKDHPRRGGRSLEVQLGTEEYSGVQLVRFPGDWRGYRTLSFSLFNPDGEPLALVVKVYDREHRARGYPYPDRFNRRVTVQPGWNDVEIPLAEIRTAPAGREMDLALVANLSWFAVRLPAPRTFYLDAVELRR